MATKGMKRQHLRKTKKGYCNVKSCSVKKRKKK